MTLVFRNATVLTMDDAHTVHQGGDVLVDGERIQAVGPHLEVPEGTTEIDATGGIVMPGMIDTHRHMWQTAMRGYGADWTLTQYFVWYYLESGRLFRPEDVHAGNLLAAIEDLSGEPIVAIAFDVVLGEDGAPFVGPARHRLLEVVCEDRMGDLVRQDAGDEPIEGAFDLHLHGEDASAVEDERGGAAGALVADLDVQRARP